MTIQPVSVRSDLIDALQIDLIGPIGTLGDHQEVLAQLPRRWYLTGFLVPTDADDDQRLDETCNEELDQAAEPAGIDDSDTPEKTAARRSYLPSSMGLSVLVPKDTDELDAIVRFGEYWREEAEVGKSARYVRKPQEEIIKLRIGKELSLIHISEPTRPY